ncbi:nucleoside triphosphate pyrophosphohydrolase [Jeotgalibacillus proteolyticus]|uniref:Phosphoribosyl-ATP pyrophosphohydrolase n=1 Tax=Jeotgalibacillus proteolyticus TaxID=2082395 RepID=A0A2S5GCU0_9BACL|nr:nucleoside triphosphate pyrophosphohydrolase [Jeotgalibacillus proteolyticus]PPA70852.1 phosphoribosyl-ATP pyrophosphohydrolase [Jeotgalibacillus proteolyticus]
MPIYNKLVRDNILQIIQQSGSTFSSRVLEDEEYLVEIKKKMHEELNEFEQAENDPDAVEELADLVELVYAAAEIHGASREQLEKVRLQKESKRGGFKKKLFLIENED